MTNCANFQLKKSGIGFNAMFLLCNQITQIATIREIVEPANVTRNYVITLFNSAEYVTSRTMCLPFFID